MTNHYYSNVIFMTMNKAAFVGMLGYSCDTINSFRTDITVLQILSVRGAQIEFRLFKFLSGGRLTMNSSLKRLVNAGHISFSMKPTKHETALGIYWKPCKTYRITPKGRNVLVSMVAYIDSKMEDVRSNPRNTQSIAS